MLTALHQQALFRVYRESRELESHLALHSAATAVQMEQAREVLHAKAVEKRLAHDRFTIPSNVMMALFKGNELFVACMIVSAGLQLQQHGS